MSDKKTTSDKFIQFLGLSPSTNFGSILRFIFQQIDELRAEIEALKGGGE